MGRKNRQAKNGCGWYGDKYWQSADMNRRNFQMYLQQLTALAVNRFRWVGLPDTCDERYLETVLFQNGVATIAENGGFLYSLMGALSGNPNMYGNPTEWECIGANGTQFKANPSTGVVIWDNRQRLPLISQIELYARKLAAVDRAADVNMFHQHTPYLLTAPKEKQNDLIQVFKQISGGEPAILALPDFSSIEINAIKTDVPFMGEQFENYKHQIYNDVYTLLGIDSLSRKSERMIQDEVLAENEPTSLLALDPLTARREACKQLNDLFGLDVHVYWNYDYESENFNYENNAQAQDENGGNDA